MCQIILLRLVHTRIFYPKNWIFEVSLKMLSFILLSCIFLKLPSEATFFALVQQPKNMHESGRRISTFGLVQQTWGTTKPFLNAFTSNVGGRWRAKSSIKKVPNCVNIGRLCHPENVWSSNRECKIRCRLRRYISLKQ